MKNPKQNIVFTIVLLLALCIRIVGLETNPVHLTSDEAALGYNAYSILKTGRDEHGVLLPIIFESFGDWKPGLYIYTAIPSIALFGLNEFAVRLPSALAGVIGIIYIYKVTHILFDNRRLSLMSAFLLAITPWHIHFSRGAWEANLALTLTLAGSYYFLKALKSQAKYLLVSAGIFGLSLWAYQGAKLSGLLLVIALFCAFGTKLVKIDKKILMSAIGVGIIFSLPIILSVLSGRAGRLAIVSIFSHSRPTEYIEENILVQDQIESPDFHYLIFHSDLLNQFRGILGRYTNHFSGRYLFFEGDWQNSRHAVSHSGNLLYINIILIPVGLYVIRTKYWGHKSIFFLFWLVLAPLPAALTRDSVHAIRSLQMVIPLCVISAFGLEYLLSWINVKRILVRILGTSLLAAMFLSSIVWYFDAYYIHDSKIKSKQWLYGYKQVVESVSRKQSSYQKVIFAQSYNQPYIFFLFYQKYNPTVYQRNKSYVPSKLGDVGYVERLDNIEFRIVNWSGDKEMNNVLIVATPTDVPLDEIRANPQTYSLEEINYIDNSLAFAVFEVHR